MASLVPLLRFAIPLLLVLARATIVIRLLLLVLVALAVAGFLSLASQLKGNRYSKARRDSSEDGKKVVDGSYTIVDDEEPRR